MAGPNAISELGDTLVQLVQAALSGLATPPTVKVATPDSFKELEPNRTPTVTIFLYRVAVNPVMRNGPRPVLGNGRTTRPLLPVELGYLITPWAKEPKDEHTVLGLILQGLYDRSELGPADLKGGSWGPEDSVQILLESLSTDEHYRIWDTVDMPYRLSLTYLARIVGIEPAEQIAAPPIVRAVFQGVKP